MALSCPRHHRVYRSRLPPGRAARASLTCFCGRQLERVAEPRHRRLREALELELVPFRVFVPSERSAAE
jgi:hypothetical protein